jgi:hypothetical protein
MNNRHDKQYLSEISNSKEKQINDESIGSTIKFSETKNVYNTCNSWSKKYNEVYDKWIKLPAEKDHDDWEKKILY